MPNFLASTWRWRALSAKPLTYWMRIVALILAGMLAARGLAGFHWWQVVSYGTYGLLLRASQSAPTHPSWTAVVLIDDDDYWLGEWARRTPLKRSTLATLVKAINASQPQPLAIALDIDLRAQDPGGRLNSHKDYDIETKDLFDTLQSIGGTTPIVLAKTVGFDAEQQRFRFDPDLFDTFNFHRAKVSWGYTRLPPDIRNITLVSNIGGTTHQSFAAAAASVVDPQAIDTARERGGSNFPFSMFLRPNLYANATVKARDVIRRDAMALKKLEHRVVVVGGAWHRDAYGRGELVDQHLTPVGTVAGAFVHANYIEALLTQRSFSPSYDSIHVIFEFVVGFALASIFVAAAGPWKLVYVLISGVIVAIVSLAAWQNLGTFFDGVPALILLGGHAIIEQILEWKDAADTHRQCPLPTVQE